MPSEIESSRVDAAALRVRPRDESDDPAIVEIGNALQPEYPPMTVERYRELARDRPEDAAERWVADLHGTVVGALYMGRATWLAHPGSYTAVIRVPRNLWGQGIGTRLYATLRERLATTGAARLYCQIREDYPEALRFAEHRGFQRTGHIEQMSRLTVADANLEGFTGLEQTIEQHGIRIVTLAEVGPDDEALLRALHDLEIRTAKDVPGPEELGGVEYDTWLRRAVRGPGRSSETIWLALDGGKPVGAAFLERVEDSVWNGYTCVDAEYRGRGIARALKQRTVEWARQNGIRFIYTGNDTQNTRMLSINVNLGYQPLPATVELVKPL